jgi:DNA-binding response OmpR family regulator
VLEGAGAQCDEAGSARETADQLALHGPARWDVVLVDHRLPDTAGTELAGWLRRQGIPPEVPILLCSGALPHGEPDLAERYGISGVVRKPFSAHELRATVKAAVARPDATAPADPAAMP